MLALIVDDSTAKVTCIELTLSLSVVAIKVHCLYLPLDRYFEFNTET